MDYLHIDSLLFKGKHGAYAPECSVEQEFAISVRLGVETETAGKSDRLEETVNYQEVKDKIRAIIEGKSRYLIEKITEEIAASILEDSRIKTVEITLKKNAVWDNGIPGITITRKNS